MRAFYENYPVAARGNLRGKKWKRDRQWAIRVPAPAAATEGGI